MLAVNQIKYKQVQWHNVLPTPSEVKYKPDTHIHLLHANAHKQIMCSSPLWMQTHYYNGYWFTGNATLFSSLFKSLIHVTANIEDKTWEIYEKCRWKFMRQIMKNAAALTSHHLAYSSIAFALQHFSFYTFECPGSGLTFLHIKDRIEHAKHWSPMSVSCFNTEDTWSPEIWEEKSTFYWMSSYGNISTNPIILTNWNTALWPFSFLDGLKKHRANLTALNVPWLGSLAWWHSTSSPEMLAWLWALRFTRSHSLRQSTSRWG